MRLKSIFPFFLFLLGLFGFSLITWFYSPVGASWQVHIGLYLGTFLVFFGISWLLLSWLWRLLGSASQRNNAPVLRQALIASAVLTAALILQAFRLLNPFTIGLLVLCAGILELYFLNNH